MISYTEFKPPIIANTPFEADHSNTKAEIIVNDNLPVRSISSMYVSKKLLIALGINSYAITVISASEEPIRFKRESKSIIIGMIDKNIKNAAWAEYALILLAPTLRMRYLVLLIKVFTVLPLINFDPGGVIDLMNLLCYNVGIKKEWML